MLSEKVRMRVLIATAVMLSGCGVTDSPGNEPEGSPEASLPSGWPSSLKAVGDGFPTPGAACRIVGESEATVNLLDEDSGTKAKYKIVGEDESAVKGGKISITSPIARALIGKEEGDVIEVMAPGGAKSYEITKVKYL